MPADIDLKLEKKIKTVFLDTFNFSEYTSRFL